tara:strand:+ start:2644 stop:3009 length:366 start_codon:yes stop_codon:yes gene_type:complete
MSKAEKFLKALLLKEYEDRLKTFSLLKESSTMDKEGNVVLEPNLKVRHKDSGFEYTVKKVLNDRGQVQIVLRTPESPRFHPSSIPNQVIAGKSEKEEFPPQDLGDEFSVDREEFEKSYEVD